MNTQAEQVATAIVKSGFWGNVNPNAVLMLCYLAEAEGHHPAVVYRDYHIMSGKPSKKAEAILRDFTAGGGKVKWHCLDDQCADATFSHASGEARIDWTLERARAAGIVGNAMWKKYPRQMLRSRCISEGVRTVYPGATSGLYEENEVADIVAQDGGLVEGQSQQGAVSRDEPADYTPLVPVVEQPKHDARKNPWSKFYSGRAALHKGLLVHEAELTRLGSEGTFDDLESYQTSPEYADFIRVASEHMPHYLEGGDPAPPEFVGIYALEQRARDMIAIRGNQPAQMEKV